MEKVENLRQYIKEAFEEFHGVQKESRQFIDDFHNSAMEIFVNGQGIKDLQNISSEAEQYVLQISEIQEQTCTLMNTLWEDILQKINTMMSEAVIQMKKYDEELLRKAQEACQQGNGELDKATQVLENIEKVKQQIECLCQMFKEPEN